MHLLLRFQDGFNVRLGVIHREPTTHVGPYVDVHVECPKVGDSDFSQECLDPAAPPRAEGRDHPPRIQQARQVGGKPSLPLRGSHRVRSRHRGGAPIAFPKP
jgi:hypothetical protein